MDKFLETYNLLRLKYKEIKYLNRQIISKEITKKRKESQQTESQQHQTVSPVNFNKHSKTEYLSSN